MLKKRKNKRDKKINNMLEDEIVLDNNIPIYDEIEVPKKKRMRRNKKEKNVAKSSRKKKHQKIEAVTPKYDFEWANVSECLIETKSNKKKKKISLFKKKDKKIESTDRGQINNEEPFVETNDTKKSSVVIDTQVSEEENNAVEDTNIKKGLDDYFVKNDSELFKSTGRKQKSKKRRRTNLRSYYRYKGKKFQTPTNLLEYLDKHPKKIEKIATLIVDDELFFEWLGKNSHQFIESVKEFRTFKKKIEK